MPAQPEPPAGSAMTGLARRPTAPASADRPHRAGRRRGDGRGAVRRRSAESAGHDRRPVEPADAGAAAAPAGAWPDVSSPPVGPRCPWCSAALPSDDLATCPSCGAQLNGPVEGDVPGVTTIDVNALAWKAGAPPRRNRIMSWISRRCRRRGRHLRRDRSGRRRTAVAGRPPRDAPARAGGRRDHPAPRRRANRRPRSAAGGTPIDAGPADDRPPRPPKPRRRARRGRGPPDAGTGAPGG